MENGFRTDVHLVHVVLHDAVELDTDPLAPQVRFAANGAVVVPHEDLVMQSEVGGREAIDLLSFFRNGETHQHVEASVGDIPAHFSPRPQLHLQLQSHDARNGQGQLHVESRGSAVLDEMIGGEVIAAAYPDPQDLRKGGRFLHGWRDCRDLGAAWTGRHAGTAQHTDAGQHNDAGQDMQLSMAPDPRGAGKYRPAALVPDRPQHRGGPS